MSFPANIPNRALPPIFSYFSGTNTAASGAGVIAAGSTDYVAKLANPNINSIMIQNRSTAAWLTFNDGGNAAWNGSALVGFDLAPGGIIVLDASISNASLHIASLTAGVPYFIREL